MLWLVSFIPAWHRQQSVVYGGTCSDTQPIKTGIPQGSILGPLLFLIYINGLLIKMPYENSLAYADNIMLVCHNKDASLAISESQNLVNIIDSESRSNCLQLNPNKSIWMLISPMLKKLKPLARCTDSTQISEANTCVHKVNQLRLLGIVFYDLELAHSCDMQKSLFHAGSPLSLYISDKHKHSCSPIWWVHQTKNELLSSCVGQLHRDWHSLHRENSQKSNTNCPKSV